MNRKKWWFACPMHNKQDIHNLNALIGRLMTLVQLRHFLELANTASFSKSAVKLHLSQPALSRSIKSIEDEFGQQLFDRVGRKIELTAFGQYFYAQARDLVDRATNLKQSSHQLLSGQTGKVRVGLGSGPGALLTSPLLKYVASEFPKAYLEIARGHTTLLVQALRDRQLDALVLDIRSLNPSSDLVVESLCELPGAFMCRKGHPLSKARQVTLAKVKDYPVASTPLSDEVARILVDRYGDFVLYRPEVKPLTWVLWFGPFLLLVLGVVGMALYLRQRQTEKPLQQQLSEEDRRKVQEILKSGDAS